MKRIIKFIGIFLSVQILTSCVFFNDSVDDRYDFIPAIVPQNSNGILSVKLSPSIPLAFDDEADSSTRSASPLKSAAEEKEYFSRFKYAAEFYTVSGEVETKITGLCVAEKVETATSFSLAFSFLGFVQPVDSSYRLKIYGFRDPATVIPSGAVYSVPDYILFSQVDVNVPANKISIELQEKIVFLPGNDRTLSADSKISLAIKLPSASDSLSYKKGDEAFKTTGVDPVSTGIKKIEDANLVPGAYEYTFLVSRSSKPLHMWTETIYVYYDLTTSTWNTGTTFTEGSYVCRDISNVLNTVFYARADNGVTSHAELWNVFDTENVDAAGYVADGTIIKPYVKLQDAIDRILSVNDGTSEYTLFVDGLFIAPYKTTSMMAITDSTLTKNLNLKIVGIGTAPDKSEFYCKEFQGINEWRGNGDANARAIQVGTTSSGISKKLSLTLQNVDIFNGGATKAYNSDGYGGGIFFKGNAESTLILDAVEVKGCKATFGGACYFSKGTFVLQHGTIIGDKTFSSAVRSEDMIASSTYFPNAALKTSTPGCGGGIYATGSDTKVTLKIGCKVIGNYNDNGSGGGLYAADGAVVSIDKGSYVQFNSCQKYGGGVFVTGSDSKLNLGASVSGNRAEVGGGIYADDGTTNLLYSNNSAITSGSASYHDESEKNYGGDVIDLKNAYVRVSSPYDSPAETALQLNNAIKNLGSFTGGGTLYIGKIADENPVTFEIFQGLKITDHIGTAASTYKIQASAWSISNSRKGRRIVLDTNGSDCVLSIDGTVNGMWKFYGLKLYRGSGTLSDGGGFTMGYNFVEMTNCDIDSCTTNGNGGGIKMGDVAGAELKLNNCTITNCSAVDGGGLYMTSSNNLLSTISMSGNTASGYGNGIFVNSQRELKIQGDINIAEDNDIFLSDADGGNSSKVNLQASLGSTSTVTTISRRQYINGYQVLGGTNAALIEANVGKFKLKDNGYCIDNSGKISSLKVMDMKDDPDLPGAGYYKLKNFISTISHTEEPYEVDFTGYSHMAGPNILALDKGQNIKLVSDTPIELKYIGFTIGSNAKVIVGENISLGGDNNAYITIDGGEFYLEEGGTISAASPSNRALEMTSGKFTMSGGTVNCSHGGIRIEGGEVEITGGQFVCVSSDSSRYAPIRLEGGSGTISNISLDGMIVGGSGSRYSSMGVDITGGTWNFNSCTIKNMKNSRGSAESNYGGGVSIKGGSSVASFTDCAIIDNEVGGDNVGYFAYGGGIYAADGCTLTVSGGNVSGNTVTGTSGAVTDGSNMFIKAGVNYNGTVLGSDYIEN